MISGVSRDFQHLPFAYRSLNGKGLFTGIDGSWKQNLNGFRLCINENFCQYHPSAVHKEACKLAVLHCSMTYM